jgi:membrane-bound lytic murein transglycosylase B
MTTSSESNYLSSENEFYKNNLFQQEAKEKLKIYVQSLLRVEEVISPKMLDLESKKHHMESLSSQEVFAQIAQKYSAEQSSLQEIMATVNKSLSSQETFAQIAQKYSVELSSLQEIINEHAKRHKNEDIFSVNTALKLLASFNLYPKQSPEKVLREIGYPSSPEQAISKDWQNIGNDLWRSYATVLSENKSSDEK